MMNVIVLASCMFAAFNGGNSLMIHNIKAEGVDEPGNNTSYCKLAAHYF